MPYLSENPTETLIKFRTGVLKVGFVKFLKYLRKYWKYTHSSVIIFLSTCTLFENRLDIGSLQAIWKFSFTNRFDKIRAH